jgi:hypothetical protein
LPEWYVAGNQDARGDGSQGADKRVLHRKADCSAGPAEARESASRDENPVAGLLGS